MNRHTFTLDRRAELADQMERRVVVPVPTRATGGVRPGDHLAQAGG
jgi:hypothetical protein